MRKLPAVLVYVNRKYATRHLKIYKYIITPIKAFGCIYYFGLFGCFLRANDRSIFIMMPMTHLLRLSLFVILSTSVSFAEELCQPLEPFAFLFPETCSQSDLEALFAAVTGGDVEAVERLLELNKDVDLSRVALLRSLHFLPYREGPLLSIAARKGDAAMVTLLLESGVDLNIPDERGFTPLHDAAYNRGPHTGNPFPRAYFIDVFELLLEWGAKVDIPNAAGRTPLHDVANGGYLGMVKRLLKLGADVNASDAYGCTPLLDAVRGGDFETVKLLLEVGAEANVIDRFGATPLSTSVFSRRVTMVKSLLEFGADVNMRSEQGHTLLHIAVLRGYFDIVKLFLEHGALIDSLDEKGDTPLSSAASPDGSEEMLRLLLGLSSDEGMTPLHAVVLWRDADVVRQLLESGVKPNALNEDGETPLHSAVRAGRGVDVIRLLLEHGANPNAFNAEGGAPLHIAVRMQRGADVIKLLLECGAFADLPDGEGRRVLDSAWDCRRPEVAELLLRETSFGGGVVTQVLLSYSYALACWWKGEESPEAL